MKRTHFLPLLLAAGLACVTTAWGHEEHGKVKHHHELRGTIVKVEAEKNQFSIETDRGQVVLCVIDEKTVVKREGKKIELRDVQAGERARCHCAALREGKHYSEQLLLEKKNEP